MAFFHTIEYLGLGIDITKTCTEYETMEINIPRTLHGTNMECMKILKQCRSRRNQYSSLSQYSAYSNQSFEAKSCQRVNF